MPVQAILTLLAILTTSLVIAADEPVAAREARPLDPDSPDVIGQFHRIGYPKYTEVEKRIIDRAQKLQDEQTAVFDEIRIGRSVFDYPGLIARGAIRFDPRAPSSYVLTFGIRPHLSVFAGSFNELQIEFDAKGVIKSKRKVPSEWNQSGTGQPATRPESKSEGGD